MRPKELEIIIEATASLTQSRANLAFCRLLSELQPLTPNEVQLYNHTAEQCNMLADSILLRLKQLGIKNESINEVYLDYSSYLNPDGSISNKKHGTATFQQLKDFRAKRKEENE